MVLEVHIERIRTWHQWELFQCRNLLCYTRQPVITIEENEIFQHWTTSLYIQFVCIPAIIYHASIYHPNPSLWSYPPGHNSSSIKPRHIIQYRNTSDHLLITIYHTATTTPHFCTFPICLPISLPFHNSSSFRTREPIAEYHHNLSLVIRAVTVSELGCRMIAEVWFAGEEAVVKERRDSERESRTFVLVLTNSIALELSQILPFSLYLDMAKFNFIKHTKTASKHILYKYIAQKVNPVPLWDGSTPDAGLDCRGWYITKDVPIAGPWYEWLIHTFSHIANCWRLTLEGLQEL